jgi:hypothetical protein
MLMEDDINLLITLEHWVSVVPHGKKWKGVIWRKVGDTWKEYKSRVQITPTKCYEWSVDIMDKVLVENEEIVEKE